MNYTKEMSKNQQSTGTITRHKTQHMIKSVARKKAVFLCPGIFHSCCQGHLQTNLTRAAAGRIGEQGNREESSLPDPYPQRTKP